MKIILAPDSFKGSLSAVEVCNYMEKGIKKALPNVNIVHHPVSDGGEGLVEVMVHSTGGKTHTARVTDPLGREIKASYGILGDEKTAIIEMAAASGLPLLKKEEINPLKTTTFGTGELIKAALDKGVSKIIVGIGGSATVDGGAGMAAALGTKFIDNKGKEILSGGGHLKDISKIDISNLPNFDLLT